MQTYKADYFDGEKTKPVTITEADSVLAVKNDYQELMQRFNPKYVEIKRLKAQSGEYLRLKITVKAPTHYLTSETDHTPKPCSSIWFVLIVHAGYPLVKVDSLYPPNHYLASPNVHRSGHTCINGWTVFTSSILTVVEKLVQDAIHNPLVSNYGSPANYELIDWHKKEVKAGRFPTMDPRLLMPAASPAPRQRAAAPVRKAPPPLPQRP